MSDPLEDIIADDAAMMLTIGMMPGNESLTYKKAVTAVTRAVTGNVFRRSPKPGPGIGLVPNIRIHFPNNTDGGITQEEWKNGDQILIAERIGAEPKYLHLHWPDDESQEQDSGMTVLDAS